MTASRLHPNHQKILDIVRAADAPVRAAAIAQMIERNLFYVVCTLSNLRDRGLVFQPAKGLWAATAVRQ